MSSVDISALDLFCGGGGFSLGLEEDGWTVLAGVDYDDAALETYDQHFGHPGIKCDLSEVGPEEFFAEYASFGPEDVDVVVGGPPCQGYSLAGDRDPDDPRNDLFSRYIEYVDYISPLAFAAENVTGILSMEDGRVIDDITDRLSECSTGYTVDYQTLNAAAYGVPQSRKRVIILGTRGQEPRFPEPTRVV